MNKFSRRIRALHPTCVGNWWRGQSVTSKGLVNAFGWSALFQVVARAQAFVLIAVSARLLDPKAFGSLVAAQALAILATSLWDLGTTSFVMRNVASGGLGIHRAIRLSLQQRSILAAPILACSITAVGVTPFDDILGLVPIVMLVAAGGVAALGAVYNAVLVGARRFSDSSRAISTGKGMGTIALVALLPLEETRLASATGIAAVLLFSETATAVGQRRAARRLMAARLDSQASMSFRTFMRSSMPHAANSMFNYAYNKGDLLLVTAFAGVTAAAAYAPASQLQNLLLLIPALLASGLVPFTSTSDTSGVAHARLRNVTGRLCRLGFALAVPSAIVLSLCMPWIMRVAVGADSEAAVAPAIILVWCFPLLVLEVPLAQALIAQNRPGATTQAYAAGFAATLVLHAALTPAYGAVGGAIASLCRDPVTLVVLVIKHTPIFSLGRTSRSRLSGLRSLNKK